MKQVKFNKYERIAGLFILFAFCGVLVVALFAAIKQGWFETKVRYSATFVNAEGIYQGTSVQMAGLQAGAVESVEFEKDNRVRVEFYVLGRFHDRVRTDSTVQLVRPFIIGERVLDLSLGNEQLPVVPPYNKIQSQETTDIMTLLSGKNMNTSLAKLGQVLESMKVILDAFADKSRAESLVRVMDRLDPLVRNMNSMSLEVVKLSKQATHDEGLQKVVKNLALVSAEMNRMIPEMNRQNPQLARDMALMMQNLATITAALGPALKGIEGDLPKASSRLIEALDQTVVTLKAIQKNYFMKSNVQEVRDEESAPRLPAGK